MDGVGLYRVVGGMRRHTTAICLVALVLVLALILVLALVEVLVVSLARHVGASSPALRVVGEPEQPLIPTRALSPKNGPRG